jgi:hypothetical protein
MRARRLIPILVAALAVLLLPAAAAEAKAKPKLKRCTARGDTTWNRTTAARVYEVGGDDHTLYGCMYDTGKRRLLTSWFNCDCSMGDDSPPTTWLTGRFVALRYVSCPPAGIPAVPPTCAGSFKVIDIRTGKTTHAVDDAPSDLVLKRNGSVAYVIGSRVVRVDVSGVKVVDEGPGIEPDSLAANGRLLYWTRGGVARSAPFN